MHINDLADLISLTNVIAGPKDTDFPYTPTHSGILHLSILGGTNSAGFHSWSISDGTHVFQFHEYMDAWGATSIVLAVCKGVTYTFSATDGTAVDNRNSQSWLTY